MKTEGIQKIGQVLSKNSPTILTGMSVAGLVTTVFMAVKATPKAMYILDGELCDRHEGSENGEIDCLTKKEIVQLTWKCYIPAAAMGVVTVGCIIGANSINLRRNAALASVYSITETALKEYQAKVVETIGENKAQKIKDEIAKDKIEKHPVKDKEVIITGRGDVLCYDSMSGRYFRGDIEKLRQTIHELNHRIIREMYIPLNDFYYEIGLESVKLGDDLGWNVDQGQIVLDFSSQLATNGDPCLVMDYNVAPKFNYCG